ncbi:hypothetical protein GSF04_11625 [Pseudoalteromonas sp. A22]|uniref:hypothetical protein n=1 Tax=Pseudoalteromonas sp. A22 TaxID=327511 RepID=UPI001BA8DA8F|nr:hypothetical protein [Pseudoalteromonas sp. A22]QUI63121.1 hypothetical protein GSF04_11625 [Pseudoalteromonas sp. A22]
MIKPKSSILAMAMLSIASGAAIAAQPAEIKTLNVYQNGLVATVFSGEQKTGTWASNKQVGVPIGEFVDTKVPAFSFINLEQDETAWSIYPGAHVGIEWNGFFHAEEAGDYILMLDLVKKDDTYFYANSCVADLSLSNSSVLKNEFKWNAEDYRTDNSRFQLTKTNSIALEKGYYPLKLWLHCGVTSNKWDYWVGDAADATWTLKVKRPSDRMVKEAPKGVLVWK